MATLQELQAAMTGFPRTLTWRDFPARAVSPKPPMLAQAGARFSLTTGTLKLVNGEYRFHGAKATVSLDPATTWAIASARSSADLLVHEQGHYDITGLIARDLLDKVLDLSMEEFIVEALRDSGPTVNQHMQYVARLFNAEFTRFNLRARALTNRLQTDPSTGQDGIYDTQTNHSKNAAGQKEWNDRFSRLKATNNSFELWLLVEGTIP
jgi:hypothetical protein